MQNIYPNLKIKMLHEIKKISILFSGFSCMHRHMCVHACYIPSSKKLLIGFWAKFYTGNILLLTKNR